MHKLSFVLLTTLLFCLHAAAQETVSGKDPLVVTLATARDCYAPDEIISVTVRITNQSKSPIYLYRPKGEPELPELRIWVYDLNDKQLIPSPRDPLHIVIPPPPIARDFLKLRAKATVVDTFRFTRGELMTGLYYLRASYRSPIFEHRMPAGLTGKRIRTYGDGNSSSERKALTIASECHSPRPKPRRRS